MTNSEKETSSAGATRHRRSAKARGGEGGMKGVVKQVAQPWINKQEQEKTAKAREKKKKKGEKDCDGKLTNQTHMCGQKFTSISSVEQKGKTIIAVIKRRYPE